MAVGIAYLESFPDRQTGRRGGCAPDLKCQGDAGRSKQENIGVIAVFVSGVAG
jgi:hypothetical protein